jgi:hypothetical protein
VSEEKDQRAGEPEEQDVEGHMRARTDDEMREMRGMRAENDEEKDDVEGHMRAAMDDEQMRGMRAANDEDDDVEGHMRAQNTP